MKSFVNHFLTTALAGLVLVLSSCDKDAYVGDPQSWTAEEQTLVTTFKENHYTPNEFVDALGAPSMDAMLEDISPALLPWADAFMKAKVLSHLPGLDRQFAKECGTSPLAKRQWEIQSYAFSYRTQSVDGREVVLSGRVTFPNNTLDSIYHQVKSISLHTHMRLSYPDWAPSENLMYMPLKALWDSAVIEPDFQEYGITYKKETSSCGSAVTQARQLADCVVAALEVMRQHGVSLSADGYTTAWGISQTAGAPLEFAKWYETQAPQWFKDQLRLKSTFVGAGVEDYPDLLRSFAFLKPENMKMNWPFLLIYPYAFASWQLGGYAPEELFSPLLSKMVKLPDGREVSMAKAYCMNYYELVDRETISSFTSFDQLFAPDCVTADGKIDLDSPKMRAWMACVDRHNDFSGWTPEHPVYIAHSPKDDKIPYEIAYAFYRRLGDFGQNPKVHMLSVPFISEIPGINRRIHDVISIVMLIQMSCAQDPEDMVKIYQPVS
jgi:hypothetical protein